MQATMTAETRAKIAASAQAQSFWTSERVDLLNRRWRENLSSTRIAMEIGCTRNSVIGKIHRLGLHETTPRRRALAPRARLARRVAAPSKKRTSGLPMALAAIPVAEVSVVPPWIAGGVALIDLREEHCRWPIWSHDTTVCGNYCGNPKLGGSSYCAGHTRLAFNFQRNRSA